MAGYTDPYANQRMQNVFSGYQPLQSGQGMVQGGLQGGGGVLQTGGAIANVIPGGQGVGAVLGALGSIAQTGGQMFNIFGRSGYGGKQKEHLWESMQPGIARLYQSLIKAPSMTGMAYPGAGQGYGHPLGERVRGAYEWSPGTAMSNLMRGYIGREYGVPEDIAGAMVAQAQSPLRASRVGGTPMQARQQTQIAPQKLTQVALKQQMPDVLRQRDYLQNAAQLAALNQWRAQQFGRLIG